MKTVLHLASILCLGVAIGLIVRSLGLREQSDAGPGADEVVFTNDNAVQDNDQLRSDDVVNASPSKPPEDEDWLSQFELLERSNQMVRSEELLGTPYVVSFFFSTCPASCVRQNQVLQELQQEFKGQNVRFLSISVDPETDRPDVLQEYAARFGADKDQWLFLTGELDYIRRVGSEIFMQPVNKKFHTDRFALVDAEGKIEGFYNWPEDRQLEALKSTIRQMLDETS